MHFYAAEVRRDPAPERRAREPYAYLCRRAYMHTLCGRVVMHCLCITCVIHPLCVADSQYLCKFYAPYSLCIMYAFMHTLCIRRPMKFYASAQIVCAFMQVLCSRRAMHVMHFMCPPKKFLCSFMRFYASKK